VEEAVSIPNFVYELGDLRSIPGTIDSLKRLTGIKRRGKKHTTLGDISDVHLQAEFGVKPLVSDLQRLWDAVANLKEQYKAYVDKAGKLQRRHYTGYFTAPSVSDSTFTVPSSVNWPGRHATSHTSVKYTATLVYTYTLPDLLKDSPEQALKKFAADRLGLHLNPTTIWNAIPFSFLIDYVVRVGDWLKQFDQKSINPAVTIWDFIESLTYDQIVTTWVTPYNRLTENGERKVGTTTLKVYQRRRSVPDTYTALQLSGLSTREIINMAALGGSRSRQHHRHG
jgi:hypothetical protein